jgi:hypothetical protein
MDDRIPKALILIDKNNQVNGDIQLRYGEREDDPIPFTLTVTSAYVSSKTGKSPANYRDILPYVEVHAEALRRFAVHQRERGYSTAEL